MRRLLAALPLLLALGACIDFVDPAGLGLARDTRVDVSFDLSTNPFAATCSGVLPGSSDSLVVCFRASVTPGFDRLGERLRVLDDTMRVMGVPLSSTVDAEGVHRYELRFLVPRAGLEEVPFTAGFPAVEGVEGELPEIRWFALGPADPDTLVRRPGEDVRVRVDLPRGIPAPRPSNPPFWSVYLYGDTATAIYTGSGLPHAAYDFPAEVLEAVGGESLRAELTWSRTHSPRLPGLVATVRMSQRVVWRVLTREERPDGTNPGARGSHTSPAGSGGALR